MAWRPVCDCCSTPRQCNATCIETELASSAHYYQAALEIYHTINEAFPSSNIWITGHSLGGALAALTGLTFASPTVTFCAPGDRMAARRLHLPQPPGVTAEEQLVWHFGHTADPIYMGSCTVSPPSLKVLTGLRDLRVRVGMRGMRWNHSVTQV